MAKLKTMKIREPHTTHHFGYAHFPPCKPMHFLGVFLIPKTKIVSNRQLFLYIFLLGYVLYKMLIDKRLKREYSLEQKLFTPIDSIFSFQLLFSCTLCRVGAENSHFFLLQSVNDSVIIFNRVHTSLSSADLFELK